MKENKETEASTTLGAQHSSSPSQQSEQSQQQPPHHYRQQLAIILVVNRVPSHNNVAIMEKEDEFAFLSTLIENVEKKKYLYDYRDPDYFNKRIKERAWKEVADICSKSVATCKHKWILLRNRFYRELKRRGAPSGSGMCYAEQWRFLQPMLFLEGLYYNIPRHTRYNVETHAIETVMEHPIFSGNSFMESPTPCPIPPKKSKPTLGETIENMEKSLAAPTASAAQKRYEKKPMTPLPIDRRLLLIRSMRKQPSLYQNELLRTPPMQRHEKQKIWEVVAKESGFEQTEVAKYKWRYLTAYMRLHLDNVANKQQRRYIPKTDNPDDKYVQLNDWEFFKEMEYIVPYVKCAANNSNANIHEKRVNPNTNDMDMLMNSVDDKQRKLDENIVSENASTVLEIENNVCEEQEVFTEEDQILKEFFENMLKSTLSLPRFHQDRVKTKLMQAIKEQSKE